MRRQLCVVIVAAMLVAGCEQGIPPEALALSQVSVEKRTLQTRFFDTEDEAKMLTAAVGVLQDLGFTLEESESDLAHCICPESRLYISHRQRRALNRTCFNAYPLRRVFDCDPTNRIPPPSHSIRRKIFGRSSQNASIPIIQL